MEMDGHTLTLKLPVDNWDTLLKVVICFHIKIFIFQLYQCMRYLAV